MRKCLGHQMIKDLPPFHSDRTSPLKDEIVFNPILGGLKSHQQKVVLKQVYFPFITS